MTFEEWFESQYFYTNMRYRFGDALFLKDGDVYRKLPVQMTYMAWKFKHNQEVQETVLPVPQTIPSDLEKWLSQTGQKF